ncbi:MAG: hypothetical protein ACK56W_14895 [Pirellula sp.]|nr:hypothetical protein [Pirellula sp.]
MSLTRAAAGESNDRTVCSASSRSGNLIGMDDFVLYTVVSIGAGAMADERGSFVRGIPSKSGLRR